MKIYIRIIGTQSTSDNKGISTTFESSTAGRDYSIEMTAKDKSELFGNHNYLD